MVKTTRRERRKRAVASGAAEARGVSKIKAKHRAPSGQHSSSKPAAAGAGARLVGKDGKQLVKRPAARRRQENGAAAQKPSPGRKGKKKRPRSQVDDEEEEDGEDDAQPVVVDELVATIQEHDQFFSRMLDMIPEHLVLPAKEVTESSYASKYMKVNDLRGESFSKLSIPLAEEGSCSLPPSCREPCLHPALDTAPFPTSHLSSVGISCRSITAFVFGLLMERLRIT